jgi:hypothetical protein
MHVNVTLIDSPVANTANIARALRTAGADLQITNDPDAIARAEKLARGPLIRPSATFSRREKGNAFRSARASTSVFRREKDRVAQAFSPREKVPLSKSKGRMRGPRATERCT